MALEIEKLLDETGWHLLQELQENARLSYTELGQRIGLSLPAVGERVRKMEEAGIITGYHTEVDLARVGLPVLAMVHLESIGGQSCQHAVSKASEIPGVLECYRVIGSDSLIIKVVAASLDHLADLIDLLSRFGIPSTSIVRSRPMKRHTITPEAFDREDTPF